MISKNKIDYDYKKVIKQGGKVVGYHLYIKGGVLGAGKYVGNLWKTKTGDAPIINSK